MSENEVSYSTGRIFNPDPGDGPYSIEVRLLAAPPPKRKSKMWPSFRLPLNQGREGTCVGHGWRHFLEAAPVIQFERSESPAAVEIYDGAVFLDPWPDNNRNGKVDRQFGTDVRSGWKWLNLQGIVGEGNSTRDVETMANWLGGIDERGEYIGGPLVLGLPWWDFMNEPTPEGYLKLPPYLPRSNSGHCMAAYSWRERQGDFDGPNSWGEHWGPRRGRWRIDANDMRRLMAVGGEAWTAQEIRVPVRSSTEGESARNLSD